MGQHATTCYRGFYKSEHPKKCQCMFFEGGITAPWHGSFSSFEEEDDDDTSMVVGGFNKNGKSKDRNDKTGTATTTFTGDFAKKAFRLGECEVWGSGKYGLDKVAHERWDLAVSLSGYVMPETTKIEISPKDKRFLKNLWGVINRKTVQRTVKVNWPDMTAPRLGKEFWEALVRDIQEQNMTRVIVFCLGGKGRTGTALACLAGVGARLGVKIDGKMVKGNVDWVEFIRSVYKKEAVETTAQIDYADRMTGYVAPRPTPPEKTQEAARKDAKERGTIPPTKPPEAPTGASGASETVVFDKGKLEKLLDAVDTTYTPPTNQPKPDQSKKSKKKQD